MKKKYLLSIICLLIISEGVFAQNSNSNKELIVLNSKNTSAVYAINSDKMVYLYYYGKKLNNTNNFISYDGTAIGPIVSTYSGKKFTEPALFAVHSNGLLSTELKYQSHVTSAMGDSIETTTVVLKDKILPFFVSIHFKVYYNEDIIQTWCTYSNKEPGIVVLKKFASASIPVLSEKYFLTKFYGSWFGEMKMEDVELKQGIVSMESKQGVRTSHNFNPSFIVSLNQPATETTGELIGGTLAWSGSWKLSFEKDAEEKLNIIGGINEFASEYPLKPGEEFSTAPLLFTYSCEGKGLMSRNFHTWARKYGIQDGKELRPVVLNSWEGNFFDFDEKKVIAMIKDAALMGVEMFVLDDGWFGSNKYQRDNDGIALGDWGVNKKRFPNGLDKTIEEARKQNMKFGIWVEAEMVNEKSEVYEKHPDWVLKENGRPQYTERNNYVLDLTNTEVQKYVFESVNKVIVQNNYISYVKWDCNSPVNNPYAPYLKANEQQQFWIKYIQSFYKICDSLVKTHPNITFQVCASGGGRVDYGSLPFFHEFWTSDNTDALQRVYIQNGTSHFFPAIAMAAHVAPVPNGITQRITPLKYRFDVSMSGRLGIELLPSTLNTEELFFAKEAVKTYKNIRPIVQFGNLYRLLSPYQSSLASLMYVTDNKDKSVVFVYQTQRMFGDFYPNIKLQGLDPEKKYKITEINVELKNKKTFPEDESIFTGEFLMNQGLNAAYWGKQGALSVNLMAEFASAVFLLEEIE